MGHLQTLIAYMVMCPRLVGRQGGYPVKDMGDTIFCPLTGEVQLRGGSLVSKEEALTGKYAYLM